MTLNTIIIELRTLMLFLIVLLVIISLFGFAIRKLLGAERKKWFSYNYLNERHRKLDLSVRIFFTTLFLISTYYTIYNDMVEIAWYFETWFIIIISLIASEIIRAFMEWKYAKNRKDFVATIVEMMFVITIVFFTIKTNFFGLFNS
ncbi:DUF4181 domain-containing protein [Lysinibacillus sp. NPDC093688]|uniref:DUF4181 domain-containing protein n=1 Tax=Lysinibacillus sp. NPDC093688 TaxID=3390577 RepID=UPI003D008C59